MTVSRRAFLQSTAAAGACAAFAGCAAAPPSAPQRILVLGGTAFLGPHFVRAARARGHSVTLFNRGRTNPGLFPDVEQLRGDREIGELDALRGRTFDVCIDTSGYVPAHVEATAKLLAPHCRHYQFISSISVYDAFGTTAARIDENASVGTVGDEQAATVRTIKEALSFYGPLKARCEDAARAALPGRVAVIRPGLIVGPGDSSDRFTWWPVRCDRGGDVLAPGGPDVEVQFVDARDLAAWMLHVAEQGVTGTFNATGFAARTTMGEVLDACVAAAARPARLVWVDEAFLAANDVRPWTQLPLWLPGERRTIVDCRRAIAAGLTFRPLADTVTATRQWARQERGDRPFARTGLPAAREAELLAQWHAERKA